jgi:hypothetical protein
MDGEPASASSNEGILLSPFCGDLIEIYLFYEYWSTETFRKNGPKEVGDLSTSRALQPQILVPPNFVS